MSVAWGMIMVRTMLCVDIDCIYISLPRRCRLRLSSIATLNSTLYSQFLTRYPVLLVNELYPHPHPRPRRRYLLACSYRYLGALCLPGPVSLSPSPSACA